MENNNCLHTHSEIDDKTNLEADSKAQDYLRLIREFGFESIGICNASTLIARDEVREMCASGRCQAYGNNWACPPHCGSIETFQKLFESKDKCFVFQTVMDTEDEFDVETMLEAEHVHSKRTSDLAESLKRDTNAFVFSAGTCTICPECTCPNEPCRFPDKRLVSMESSGLVVNDICIAADIPYNHGRNTIAYTGCLLV